MRFARRQALQLNNPAVAWAMRWINRKRCCFVAASDKTLLGQLQKCCTDLKKTGANGFKLVQTGSNSAPARCAPRRLLPIAPALSALAKVTWDSHDSMTKVLRHHSWLGTWLAGGIFLKLELRLAAAWGAIVVPVPAPAPSQACNDAEGSWPCPAQVNRDWSDAEGSYQCPAQVNFKFQTNSFLHW